MGSRSQRCRHKSLPTCHTKITAHIACRALTSSTTLSCAAPNSTTRAAIAHSRIITPHSFAEREQATACCREWPVARQ